MKCKRILFNNIYNFRDIGGYEVENGIVDFNKIFRSDVPANLSNEEWDKIKSLSVRTIIDLRSSKEQEMVKYTVSEEIERISFPLEEYEINEEESLEKQASSSFGTSLTEGYSRMVENNTKRVVEVLNLIGKKLENGAVLYHCMVGKDRTGVITALLYLICGVQDEDIVADYQVSETYLSKNKVLQMVPTELKHLLTSKPETMVEFLRNAKDKDYIKLLKENGLNEKLLQERLLAK